MAVMVQADHPEPRVSHPKPVVSSLALKPPLIRTGKDDSLWKLESQCNAQGVILGQSTVAHRLHVLDDEGDVLMGEDALYAQTVLMDKTLLRLMQETCKVGHMGKVLDLASRLQLDKSFEIAIKVSQHFRNRPLSERINALRMRRQEEKYAVEEFRAEQQPSAEAQYTNNVDEPSISPTMKNGPTAEGRVAEKLGGHLDESNGNPVLEEPKKPLKQEWAKIFQQKKRDEDDDQDEEDNSVSRKSQDKIVIRKRKGG
jgi:hypothetical protein